IPPPGEELAPGYGRGPVMARRRIVVDLDPLLVVEVLPCGLVAAGAVGDEDRRLPPDAAVLGDGDHQIAVAREHVRRVAEGRVQDGSVLHVECRYRVASES